VNREAAQMQQMCDQMEAACRDHPSKIEVTALELYTLVLFAETGCFAVAVAKASPQFRAKLQLTLDACIERAVCRGLNREGGVELLVAHGINLVRGRMLDKLKEAEAVRAASRAEGGQGTASVDGGGK